MNPAEAKNLSHMLIAGVERESQTTRKVIAAIPENQLDYKLGDKGRTTRELAWHIVASEGWFADGIAQGDFSQPEAEMPANASVKDMLAVYDQLPAKIEKLKGLSGEDLSKIVSFFGVMQMPNVIYLTFLNNHSIHHRGQLSTYLRAMNAHVPSIYGGSADEPFQMPAGAS
jgi:uncharacterized damage-inducible protein DinB